jgi:predicted flap endonuclease-1-like 5' DNA nuclease
VGPTSPIGPFGGGRPAAEASLEEIKGIGEVYARRLKTAGIKDVEALSKASLRAVAAALGIRSLEQAKELIDQAKKMVGKR